jgi:serine/threonine protein kinase
MSSQAKLHTAFAEYEIHEQIGEGGAGQVFRATTSDGVFALKILRTSSLTSSKQKRFRNETNFLRSTSHPNIVPFVDSGYSEIGKLRGPFYVMPLYAGNLRSRMRRGIGPSDVLTWYSGMLDGVEASHLRGVVHRDLKPENFLCGYEPASIAVADFGVASFTDEELWTAVDTGAGERLANFLYASPEQRERGKSVGVTADIFALGELLNEMFTGECPAGAGYKQISAVSPQHSYLDELVSMMIQRDPASRPQSIAEVKTSIMRYETNAIVRQKLDEISKRVIPEGENSDPLAHSPPRIVNVDWDRGQLTIEFDQTISNGWIDGLLNMGGHSAVYGKGPESFTFRGSRASISARDSEVQPIIDHFKNWLPRATAAFRQRWDADYQRRRIEEQRNLDTEREAQERRKKLLGSIKF